jgi:hypothetical protein
MNVLVGRRRRGDRRAIELLSGSFSSVRIRADGELDLPELLRLPPRLPRIGPRSI